MSSDKDRVFFRNYAIVIALLTVMIIVFLILARILGVDPDAVAAKQANKVSANTVAVGQVRLEGDVVEEEAAAEVAAATSPAADEDPAAMGERVYNGLCVTCHSNAAMATTGIPQMGDVAGWTDRIAQGMPLLYERAIVGFTGASGIPMPAKGGNPSLSDEEVKAAVDHMVAKSQ